MAETAASPPRRGSVKNRYLSALQTESSPQRQSRRGEPPPASLSGTRRWGSAVPPPPPPPGPPPGRPRVVVRSTYLEKSPSTEQQQQQHIHNKQPSWTKKRQEVVLAPQVESPQLVHQKKQWDAQSDIPMGVVRNSPFAPPPPPEPPQLYHQKRQWDASRDIPRGKVSSAATTLVQSSSSGGVGGAPMITSSPSPPSESKLFVDYEASTSSHYGIAPLVHPRNQWNAQEDIPAGKVKDNVWNHREQQSQSPPEEPRKSTTQNPVVSKMLAKANKHTYTTTTTPPVTAGSETPIRTNRKQEGPVPPSSTVQKRLSTMFDKKKPEQQQSVPNNNNQKNATTTTTDNDGFLVAEPTLSGQSSDSFFAPHDDFENQPSPTSGDDDDSSENPWIIARTPTPDMLTKIETQRVDSWGAAASKSIEEEDDSSWDAAPSNSWNKSNESSSPPRETNWFQDANFAKKQPPSNTTSWGSSAYKKEGHDLERDIVQEFQQEQQQQAPIRSTSSNKRGFTAPTIQVPQQQSSNDDTSPLPSFEDFDQKVELHLQEANRAPVDAYKMDSPAGRQSDVTPFNLDDEVKRQLEHSVAPDATVATTSQTPAVASSPVGNTSHSQAGHVDTPSRATKPVVEDAQQVSATAVDEKDGKKSKRKGFFKMFSKRTSDNKPKSAKKSKNKSSRVGFRHSKSAAKDKQPDESTDVSKFGIPNDSKAAVAEKAEQENNAKESRGPLGDKSELQLSPREGEGTVVSELSNPTIFNNLSKEAPKGSQQVDNAVISPNESLLDNDSRQAESRELQSQDKDAFVEDEAQTEKENEGFSHQGSVGRRRDISLNVDANAKPDSSLDPFDVNSPVFSSGDPFGFRPSDAAPPKKDGVLDDPFFVSEGSPPRDQFEKKIFAQEEMNEPGVLQRGDSEYDDPEPGMISSDDDEDESSSEPAEPKRVAPTIPVVGSTSRNLQRNQARRSSPVPFDEGALVQERTSRNVPSKPVSAPVASRPSSSYKPPRAEILDTRPRKVVPKEIKSKGPVSVGSNASASSLPQARVSRAVAAPLNVKDLSNTSGESSALERRKKAKEEWNQKYGPGRLSGPSSGEEHSDDATKSSYSGSMWRGQGEESSLRTGSSVASASAPFAMRVSRNMSSDRSVESGKEKKNYSSLPVVLKGSSSSDSNYSGAKRPRSILKKPRRAVAAGVSTPVMTNPADMDPLQLAGMRLLATAVTPIQAMIRRYLAEREALNRMFGLIVIQAYMRRWIVKSRLGTNRSATKLQACVRRWIAYRNYRFYISALKIQTFARQKHAEIDYLTTRDAAVTVQAAFRGWLIRDIIDDRHFCATQIQRIVRGYLATISVYDDIYKVTLVQSFIRMKLAIEDATYRLAFIIQVQSIIRGYLVRQHLEKVKRSALAIQRMWRGRSAAMNYNFDRLDVIIVQSVVRRWAARKEYFSRKAVKESEDYARRVRAAVVIQSQWRSYDDCMNYLHYLADVLIVQSVVRRWSAQRTLKMKKRSAVLIQKTWRQFWRFSNFLMILDYAIRIQARVRSFLACKRMKRDLSDIIIAQTQCRSYLASKEANRLKSIKTMETVGVASGSEQIDAATKIQSAWRVHHRDHQRTVENGASTIQRCWRQCMTRSAQREAATKIQAAIRRSLAINVRRDKLLDLTLSMGSAHEIASRQAATEIHNWWRAQAEKGRNRDYAAVVVQRFFRKVREEVDNEVRRLEEEETKKTISVKRVQRTWREYERRRNRSAVVIQSTWRGFVSHSDYVFTLCDIVMMQKVVRGYNARNDLKSKAEAATAIQAHARRCIAINRTKTELVERTFVYGASNEAKSQQAAYRLQKFWRMYAWRVRAVNAANKLNLVARVYLARQEIKKRRVEQSFQKGAIEEAESRRASTTIQRSWVAHRQRGREDNAARALQGFFLAIQAERNREQEKSAIAVQRAWRCFIAYKDYVDKVRTAVVCQRIVRGYLSRKKTESMASDVRVNEAALDIQRVYRGCCARNDARLRKLLFTGSSEEIRSRIAATVIQRWWRHTRMRLLDARLSRVYAEGSDEERLSRFAARSIQKSWLAHKQRRREDAAALCIQRFFVAIQADIRRELEREKERRQKKKMKKYTYFKSAATIQSAWRGYVANSNYVLTVQAALNIQRVYRGCSARAQIELHYLEDYAAYLIQQAWRLHRMLDTGSSEEVRSLIAAKVIQRWWRSFRVQLMEARLDSIYHEGSSEERQSSSAARTIQKCWLARKQRSREDDAARTIQLFFQTIQAEVNRELERERRRRKKKHERKQEKARQTKLQNDSACRVQALWRGYTCRRYYSFFQSAVIIQSAWRGFIAYTDYVFTMHDIVFCQRIVRGFLARRKVEPMIFDMLVNEAALDIQRVYRGYSSRKQIEEEDLEDYAAYLIQKGWRLRKMVDTGSSQEMRSRIAVTVIQSWWRDCRKQLWKERLYRVYAEGSSDELQSRRAARTIQTWWRGEKASRDHKAGLIILRFLRWVKAEVDREFARQEEKKRQRAMETEDDFLERIWNNTVQTQEDITMSDIVRAEQAAANELMGAHRITSNTHRASSAQPTTAISRRSTQRSLPGTRPMAYERSKSGGHVAASAQSLQAQQRRPSSRTRHVRANSETAGSIGGLSDLILPASRIKHHDKQPITSAATPHRSRPPLLASPPVSSSRRIPRSAKSNKSVPASSVKVRRSDASVADANDDDDHSEISALTPQSIFKGQQQRMNDSLADDFSLNQAWMAATENNNDDVDPSTSPLLATTTSPSPTKSDSSWGSGGSKRKSFRWRKKKATI